MWYKRLLAVYRPQHLVSRERESERHGPLGGPLGWELMPASTLCPADSLASEKTPHVLPSLFRKPLTKFSTSSQVKTKSD